MADFNKPATTDTYANVIAYLNAKFSDLALGLDPANTTATNVPTNAVRWNSANNRFEKFDGTSWAIWTATLALTNLSASGSVTLGGGTANGVPYLNGSKVLTSGSALTFDGSKLEIVSSGEQLKLTSSGDFTTTGTGYLRFYDSVGAKGFVGYGGTAARFDINTGPSINLNLNAVGGTMTFATANSEQMRLTSTGLGIGTSSVSEKLTVAGSMNLFGRGNTYAFKTPDWRVYNSSTGNALVWDDYTTERMRLDAAGNLGLGVAPSAWSASAKAFQFGVYSALYQNASGYPELAFNAYQNTSNVYTYLNTDVATRYSQTNGQHRWYTAPSGTAGTTATFTQAMTLDASGNLVVGSTSTNGRINAYRSGNGNYLYMNDGTESWQLASTGTGLLQIGSGSFANTMTFDRSGIITAGAGNVMLISGTSQATTSGTTKDFTGIPSWAKKITVMFNGVSTNGTSLKQVQIGSGSVQTTGYSATGGYFGSTNLASAQSASSGFIVFANTASDVLSGHMTLTALGGNVWVCSHVMKEVGGVMCCGGGDVTLSGALDRIRITTVNGTDAFDAGSVNILYE